MSTNFYLPTNTEGDATEGLHIGKDSAGWTFGFRAHRDLGLTSRKAWEAKVAEVGAVVTEYGVEITPEEFWARVDETRVSSPDNYQPRRRCESKALCRIPLHSSDFFADDDGWDFTASEFC